MSQDPDKINTLRVTYHRPLRAVAFCTDKVPDKGFVFLGEGVERGDGLAKHDQDVRGSLGVDITQGHAPIVLSSRSRRRRIRTFTN